MRNKFECFFLLVEGFWSFFSLCRCCCCCCVRISALCSSMSKGINLLISRTDTGEVSSVFLYASSSTHLVFYVFRLSLIDSERFVCCCCCWGCFFLDHGIHVGHSCHPILVSFSFIQPYRGPLNGPGWLDFVHMSFVSLLSSYDEYTRFLNDFFPIELF